MLGTGDILWLPSYRIGALLLVLLGAALCFVPLFNILGFEFSLAIAPLALLVSALTGIGAARHARRAAAATIFTTLSAPVTAILLRLWAANLLLVALPAVLALLNGLRVKTCDYGDGFYFYLMAPVFNVLFGSALGLFLGLASRQARQARAWLVLFVLAALIYELVGLYTQPVVFAYNQLVGYFPGPLYDAVVEVTAPYLWFRAQTACFIIVLWATATALCDGASLKLVLERPRAVALLVALLAALGALLLHARRAELGFEQDRSSIQSALGGEQRSPHFIIYYDRKGRSARDPQRLADDHEFQYDRLVRWMELDAETLGEGPIRSYVYAGRVTKRALMGAGRTMIAKPWLGELHLNDASFPHPTLAHELAHVLSARFAPGPFKVPGQGLVAANMGLVEGLAVAAAWVDADRLTPHQWSVAMQRLKLMPKLTGLLNPAGFWREPAGRAYQVAGSFVRYLVDQYGIASFKEIYGGGDYEEVYGRPLSSLEQEWLNFLSTVELSEIDLKVAERRLRRPAIFQQVCAREIAQLRRDAAKAGKRRKVEIWQEIDGFEPDEPRNLHGYFKALLGAGRIEEALEMARRILSHKRTPASTRADVLSRRGDQHAQQGKIEDARVDLESAQALHASDGLDRLAAARLQALSLPAPQREVILAFLRGAGHRRFDLLELKEVEQAVPGYRAVHYLLGRQLYQGGRYAEALRYFSNALAPAAAPESAPVDSATSPVLALPPELAHENRRLMAHSRFLLGRFDAAAQDFDALANSQRPRLERLRFAEWAARSRFMAARGDG